MTKRPLRRTESKNDGEAKQDPFRDREASRYEHPIPSREFILEVLSEAGIPMVEDDLARALKVRPDEREALGKRLAAMEREGQTLRNRKGAILVAQKLALIPGRVIGHPDGFGFLKPDDGGDDLFLSPRQMRKVLHGDRVMGRAGTIDRRGRREGDIVEVIEHVQSRIVGKLHSEHGYLFVKPSDRRIAHEIVVAGRDVKGAEVGQVVVIQIIDPPAVDSRESYSPPAGNVIEVLGNATDPGIEIEIALRKHALPFEFSAPALAQADRFSPTVRKGEWEGRTDIRGLPLVTIDGETARDFDDAVYCEKEGKGFRLLVAIADVSHYVRPGDALDVDARERGTSVYFPRRVIPMLPEKLSNGLCSINPDVDRLCMTCDMSISPSGEIKRFGFYAAVMRSHARLTYTSVAEALSDPSGKTGKSLGPLLGNLQELHALFKVLLKARERRGAIEFESLETKFEFDAKGRLERIVRVERNDAHRLIEECMLSANVCASEFLEKNKHKALFRVHEGPTPEKLEALREFLAGFGMDLGGGDEPTAKDYGRLMEKIRKRPDATLLQTVLLRSMQQAVYSPENLGHFGLAYDAYAHFTSPIRRYPDLLVHRAIKAVLAHDKYDPGGWEAIGVHCSHTERRADDASRDVESWLKCYYMKDREGEVFEGSVTGVAGFGLFVTLDDYYVEGMVHVSELGADYFQFDPKRHELRGERGRSRFRLADRVRVKIARVDLETSRMEFVLA